MRHRAFVFTGLFVVLNGIGCGADDVMPPASNKAALAPWTPPPYGVVFESAQVRPLALSPDGDKLFAVNTPNNSLEIFAISGRGILRHRQSVPVGLEPVSVAAQSTRYVWVVNHVSDSISIVDLSLDPPTVVRTLLVGDEPRDIVFAGPRHDRAFVTTAHRGQNSPVDPQLTTPGVPRADVWVFDSSNLGEALNGPPTTIISLFGDTPRALAASPDGSRVYAAVLHSGNRTTVINTPFAGALSKPPPSTDINGVPAPGTGLIVQFNGSHWVDNGDPVTGIPGALWDDSVPFSLPDYDVFAIDARPHTPVEVRRYSQVGTTLFNMAVNPVNGDVYVSNTEARNQVRFEGPGTHSTTVRGHVAESRITVLHKGRVLPRHLNKHIRSYDQPVGTPDEKALSIAQPLGMAISNDGKTLYVAGFGSAKIGVYDTGSLAEDTFSPSLDQQVLLSAGGPTGVILDERRNRLYALTRFDDGISTVDTEAKKEIGHVRMFNAEPPSVVAGRPFLYDATLSSSRGDTSCASCHIFGDRDHLSWDLGNPDGEVKTSPNVYVPLIVEFLTAAGALDSLRPRFHPLKGPMTTQTLRGMSRNGPLHWRGDRTGVDRPATETLEVAAFKEFNPAFVSLVGRDTELSDEQMDAFAQFAMQISFPPPAVRALDNSLTPSQKLGLDTFMNDLSEAGSFSCNDCHHLDPINERFGTTGNQSSKGAPINEDFKVPHLRALYEKVGEFGDTVPSVDRGGLMMGPQISGFGYGHGGEVANLTSFLNKPRITLDDPVKKAALQEFLYVLDSDFAPIVGQQVTLTRENLESDEIRARLNLLLERAAVREPRPECDLIAHLRFRGEQRGALYEPPGRFILDRKGDPALATSELLALVKQRQGQPITFTCVPPGTGPRLGLDRDGDGFLNGDEANHED